jgi:hypothetical protein
MVLAQQTSPSGNRWRGYASTRIHFHTLSLIDIGELSTKNLFNGEALGRPEAYW